MITLTNTAKEKIIDVLIYEKKNFLRFGVQGGGCNGFQYQFLVSDSSEEDDTVIPIDDVYAIIVDPMSAMYVDGTSIDYKRDLMGETFVFDNPNTTSKCGCNQSVGFG